MGKENEGTGGRKEGKEVPSMEDVIKETEKLLRAALQKGRPEGIEWKAVKLYHDTDDSKGKTAAMLAACLSNWESLVQQLERCSTEDEPLSVEEVTARLVHRSHLRKRRKNYRDKQMDQQTARANVRSDDKEFRPFDPPAPEDGEISLKDLEEEIALLLEKRSIRDRMVLELWLDEYTYEEIVEKIKATLPSEPICPATVTRIVQRFRDELRGRLEEE
jgi:chromatin segregation and condensation protein Rec8/ScpA/Scc1 (kleisin family)